jgi:hypothetical protein
MMYPGDDIIELKFAFHEQVIFSFSFLIASINNRERFEGMFNDGIDIGLRLICDIVRFGGLSFGSVDFGLVEVS